MALKRRFLWGLAPLSLVILVVGCSRPNGATDTPTATATGAVATVTLSPEPTPTATPTPEPTPVSPGVVITDQTLDESGVLIADEVSLPGPGWVVIYRAVDEAPDEVIGRQPLAAGVHKDVAVTVDTDAATEQLFAGVHMDVGAEGVFEFPGEDEPYPGEPETVFVVELLLPYPHVEVTDQAVAEDGVVTLGRVELLEPTWVVIHTDEDGRIGSVVGGRLLEAGVHENVPLTIDWRRATPVLYAALHEDDGQAGVLEYPDGDMPLLRGGEPIVTPFKATYPPEVLVYDQPVIDGAITVERVISDGPGWVVIYNDAEGQPGLIIGSAPLTDGLNEAVAVDLVQSAITPQLFARLHQDTQPDDAFNFPGQDPPVLYNNRMPRAAAFRTDNGAHVFVRDQRLGEGDTVMVDAVVTPVNAWAAVYSDSGGQPGDLLGHTWIPAGIGRDVVVPLDPVPTPGRLHLVLYRDLGAPEEFEVPGDDPPLANEDNRPIRIPFTLYPPPGE